MKKELRQLVHKKYGCRCAYCGESIEYKQMQVDHIIPRVQGGKDDFANLNPSCQKCNNYKHFWSIEQFRREIESQVERARRYSVNFRLAEKFGFIKVIDEKPKFKFFFETSKLLEAV